MGPIDSDLAGCGGTQRQVDLVSSWPVKDIQGDIVRYLGSFFFFVFEEESHITQAASNS